MRRCRRPLCVSSAELEYRKGRWMKGSPSQSASWFISLCWHPHSNRKPKAIVGSTYNTQTVKFWTDNRSPHTATIFLFGKHTTTVYQALHLLLSSFVTSHQYILQQFISLQKKAKQTKEREKQTREGAKMSGVSSFLTLVVGLSNFRPLRPCSIPRLT